MTEIMCLYDGTVDHRSKRVLLSYGGRLQTDTKECKQGKIENKNDAAKVKIKNRYDQSSNNEEQCSRIC